jgi:hypothetical protein
MKKFIKYYVLATLIVVALAGVWIAIPFIQAGPPVAAGTAFLETLQKDSPGAAYRMTAEEFRKNVSSRMVLEYSKLNPILINNEEFSFYTRQVEDGFAKLGGTMISEEHGVDYINVQLVFEEDEWRVLGFDNEDPLVIDERVADDISYDHFVNL